MIRACTIALALSLAACGGEARPADFRIVEIDASTAKLVDFGAIETDRDGSRAVTVIGVASAPMQAVPGKGAQFVHFKFRFDCKASRYRGEGVFAYDRQFKPVDTIGAVSPWRPVNTDPRLTRDFDLYCSAEPAAASQAERVPSKTWNEAAEAVRRRLQSPRAA